MDTNNTVSFYDLDLYFKSNDFVSFPKLSMLSSITILTFLVRCSIALYGIIVKQFVVGNSELNLDIEQNLVCITILLSEMAIIIC